MTTADEKMRQEFEAWWKEDGLADDGIGANSDAWITWQASAAQYSARIKELEQQNDSLKARIESAEKQRPVARFSNTAGTWFQVPYDCKDSSNVFPLYFRPIPSPDTQELIRKAVEEEREACAKVCYSEWEQYLDSDGKKCAEAILSRSTKEGK